MSSSQNIDTLQYLQKLKGFVTYETVWLGVFTYKFLCKETRPYSHNIHEGKERREAVVIGELKRKHVNCMNIVW